MKRAFCLFLSIWMLVGLLVGCGGNGTDGKDGITPVIGANGNWFIGETDTGVKAAGKDGVGIDKIKAELATDANGETYVNFTCEMSDKTVKTVKVPLAQNGQSGQGAYLVPQPVALDYYQGKRAVFIGTSTTCGVGASTEDKNYVNQVAKLLGLETAVNVGVSGSVMATGSVTCNFNTLSLANCANADLVILQVGGNDFSNAKKNVNGKNIHDMGEFLTDDTTTIYGAVKMWCEKILELKQNEACKNTKFFFITPSGHSRNTSVTSAHSSDQNKENILGIKVRDICEAMIETCNYYKIPVLDMNLYDGLYYKNASNTTYGKYQVSDGIHLNDAGHALFAENLYRLLLVNPTYVSRDEAIKYLASGVDAYAEAGLTADPVPTITYQTSVGTAPKSVDARRLPVVMPMLADQGGFTFGGWYKDAACTDPVKPGEVICSDITLYANWQ